MSVAHKFSSFHNPYGYIHQTLDMCANNCNVSETNSIIM